MATPKEGNPLWMLFILYFVPCEFLHRRQRYLKTLFFSNPAMQDEIGQEFMTFTLYWLASLFVVAEGWKELKLSQPLIDKMIDEHWDSLRLFRNGVFHFQPQDRKHRQFIEVEKFNWAEELHDSLRRFFESQNG